MTDTPRYTDPEGYHRWLLDRLRELNDEIEHSPELRFVLMRIFIRYDPMGIVYESNRDEYRAEVEALLKNLPAATDWHDVYHSIVQEFGDAFSPSVARTKERRDKYEALAKAVWEAWRRNATVFPPPERP